MKISPYFLRTTDDFSIQVLPLIDNPFFYALMASDTWPRPEINFLRKLAYPTLRMLDLDYGIGFHSLLMAKLCGEQAKIFSVVLNNENVSLARASIDKNSFSQIESLNVDGTGHIYAGYPAGDLDSYLGSHFRMLDLVRINYSEIPTIAYFGASFLAAQSPLLMIEVEGQSGLGELTSQLQPHGYQLLRYIPGLNALTPATPNDLDDDTTCVFFCKQDRLQDLILRELAFVAEATNRPIAPAKILLSHFSSAIGGTDFAAWKDTASVPPTDEDSTYFAAAAGALMGMDFPFPLPTRFDYLQDAYRYFQQFKMNPGERAQKICFFIVALSLGKRREAFDCLKDLVFNTSDREPVPPLPLLIDQTVANSITAAAPETWLRSYLLECYANCHVMPRKFDPSQAELILITAAEQKRISASTLTMEKQRILASGWLGLPHTPLAREFFETSWPNMPAWRDMTADNGKISYHHNVTERDISTILDAPSDDRLKTAYARCLKNGITFSTYLDIGCAEGTSSISYYKSGIFRNLKIVNVDPNELYSASLTQIAAVTGGTYLQCAVSDYDGEAEFQESGHEYWASLLPPDSPYWNDYRANEVTTRSVPVKTIASIVKDLELKGPIVIKMDVQGVETLVLKGIKPVKDDIALLVVETFAVDLTSIHSALDDMGFTLFDIVSQAYYQKGILGWFYPVYLNKKYLPLFENDPTEDSQGLLDLQHQRRKVSDEWIAKCVSGLMLEKSLSSL